MSRIPGEEIGLQPEVEPVLPESADGQMALFSDPEIFAEAEPENVNLTEDEFQVAVESRATLVASSKKSIRYRKNLTKSRNRSASAWKRCSRLAFPVGGWRTRQQMGGYHIIREPTDDEVRALNTTLGVDLKTKPPAIDVNFDRIIQADDEEAVMRELLQMSKDFVEQEKRGSQPFQQTIANANLRLGGGVITGVKKKIDDVTKQ